MIVHAGANRVPTRVVVHAVQANARIAGANVPPVVVGTATRNIGVEVFDLRRPVRHEHPLSATASRPAGLRGRAVVPAQQTAVTRHVSIGETTRAVDQQGRHDGQADAATNRAEPRNTDARAVAVVAEVVVVAAVAVRAHRGALEVGFGADQSAHAAEGEAAHLVVVADLATTDHAAGHAIGHAAVHAIEVPGVAVAIAGVPAAANVQTGVEARPHRGRGRGRQDRSLARGQVSGERRTRQDRQRDGRKKNLFHNDQTLCLRHLLFPNLKGSGSVQ